MSSHILQGLHSVMYNVKCMSWSVYKKNLSIEEVMQCERISKPQEIKEWLREICATIILPTQNCSSFLYMLLQILSHMLLIFLLGPLFFFSTWPVGGTMCSPGAEGEEHLSS